MNGLQMVQFRSFVTVVCGIGLLGWIMVAVSKVKVCLDACEAVRVGCGSESEGNTCDLLTVLLYVGYGVCV